MYCISESRCDNVPEYTLIILHPYVEKTHGPIAGPTNWFIVSSVSKAGPNRWRSMVYMIGFCYPLPVTNKVCLCLCTALAMTSDLCDVDQKTIHILNDDTLLDIFDVYVDEAQGVDGWHTLVHVCRRWRNLVFASPLRLDLRVLCTEKTPAGRTMDVWPTFPIVVLGHGYPTSPGGADNIIAAFEHHDRVCHISLSGVLTSLLERIAEITQEPFLALAHLELLLHDKSVPLLPDTFLGGSAPHLQTLNFGGIPLKPLQRLLSSATGLVDLHLWNLPHSGYISPNEMVTCLSELTMLQSLRLGFRSPRSFPNQSNRLQPPNTRTFFPALTSFEFHGVSEFLEDLVAQIETPLLYSVKITLFNQLIVDIVHFPQFIGRIPKFKALIQANVVFLRHTVTVNLTPREGTAYHTALMLRISCREPDWQLSLLGQIYSPSFPPLSTLEYLDIREDRFSRPHWLQDDMESALLLELLSRFSAVKSLSLSPKLARLVTPALQQLIAGSRVINVLPALKDILLEEPQPSGLEKFVAARQLSGLPVVIHHSR